jgi:hypothetical protein
MLPIKFCLVNPHMLQQLLYQHALLLPPILVIHIKIVSVAKPAYIYIRPQLFQ